jgi:predicted transcriptional regulator
MKDSTIRTILRRLEAKAYVTHTVEGRTFLCRATEAPASVASRAARHVIDQFCGGSAEALIIGLVDHAVLTPAQLDRLAKKIAERKRRWYRT